MPFACEGPPRRGSADGPGRSCLAASPSIPPNSASLQAEILPFPHRAGRPVQRRLRITVRISAADSHGPRGRTRPLRLTEPDLAWLLEAAEQVGSLALS